MKTRNIIGVIGMSLAFSVLGYLPVGVAEEGKNIEQMVTTAKTPADHKAIADFYRVEGSKLQREGEQHTELVKKAVSEAGGQMPWASHHYEWAEHCRKLADLLEKAAQEAQSLAKFHEGLARSSEGTGGEKK